MGNRHVCRVDKHWTQYFPDASCATIPRYLWVTDWLACFNLFGVAGSVQNQQKNGEIPGTQRSCKPDEPVF